MPVRTIDLVGYAAATMTTISFVPQLLRVIRLRSARDISLVMFVVMSVGTAGWIAYGLLLHSRPIILCNCITLSLALAILALKLRFDRHATDATQPGDAPR